MKREPLTCEMCRGLGTKNGFQPLTHEIVKILCPNCRGKGERIERVEVTE